MTPAAARVEIPGEAGERITVEAVSFVPDDLPTPGDAELAVEVAARGFAGRNPSVWVDRRVLDAFLAALRVLEATRRGEAELVSMSPGKLALRFRSVDRAGHIQVECDLYAGFLTQTGWAANRVSVVFDLPGEMMPGVLAAFERIPLP